MFVSAKRPKADQTFPLSPFKKWEDSQNWIEVKWWNIFPMRQNDGFVTRRFEFRKSKTVILHEQLDSLPPVCYPGPVCPEELCQDCGHRDVSKFRLSIALGVHCWFTDPQTEGEKDKLTQMSTLACMLMEQRGIFPPFLLIYCLLTNDWHSRSNPPLSSSL